MGGSDTVLEVSSTQLEALSGGNALQKIGARMRDAANKKAQRSNVESIGGTKS
jgi:hypothetical protein